LRRAVNYNKTFVICFKNINMLMCQNSEQRDHLEKPGVDGSIKLRWIFRKWNGSVEWIGLAQDRDRWRVLVNWVMNFWVP
jgi:hypothetical protein